MTDTRIFGDVAPLYYKRGLSVIPLKYHDKRPLPMEWQKYHNILPTDLEQENWINQYPQANIGLVLGEQSGICVMDIDTEDEALTNAILSVLPPSPWVRIGNKGMVLAYRWSKGISATFRIKDNKNKTIVECLSSRTQVVLPPSIHPATLRPYTANAELLDVIDQLVQLPDDIEERLRASLGK